MDWVKALRSETRKMAPFSPLSPVQIKSSSVSVQRHPSPYIGRHVQVLALVAGWLAFVEAAFVDEFEGELALAHFWAFTGARRAAALPARSLPNLLSVQPLLS